jgi:hypothetical protein
MPRHFSKMMFSPYFQSNHYQNESASAKIERKIEYRVKKVLSKFGLVRKPEDELRRIHNQSKKKP